MAGVTTALVHTPHADNTAGALTFDIDRAHYRLQVCIYAVFLVACLAVTVVIPINEYVVTIPLALVVVVLAFGVASNARVLLLPEPALLIDRDGIFDRRLTREPVPWSKIERVYVREIRNDDRVLPNSFVVVIDVGHPRHADVIEIEGLMMQSPSDDAALARQIADHASKMRARHAPARAGHSTV